MYIFGYGSLINHQSRKLTGQTGEALPAKVSGLVRSWGKVDGTYKIAPLVAVEGHGVCNGVLVPIQDIVLKDFDRREKGYRRIELDPTSLIVEGCDMPNVPVWTYVRSDVEPPCQVKPIMQTYVDTVLAGCFSISQQFAKTFVETTSGWHHPLFDDRQQPRYGNYVGVSENKQALIDSLVTDIRRDVSGIQKNGKTE